MTISIQSVNPNFSARRFHKTKLGLAALAMMTIVGARADEPKSTPIDKDQKALLVDLNDGGPFKRKLTEKQMQVIWDLGGRGPWPSVMVQGTNIKAPGLYYGADAKTKQQVELSVGLVNGYANYYPNTRNVGNLPKGGVYAVVISPSGKTTTYYGPGTLYKHEYVAEPEPKK